MQPTGQSTRMDYINSEKKGKKRCNVRFLADKRRQGKSLGMQVEISPPDKWESAFV